MFYEYGPPLPRPPHRWVSRNDICGVCGLPFQAPIHIRSTAPLPKREPDILDSDFDWPLSKLRRATAWLKQWWRNR